MGRDKNSSQGVGVRLKGEVTGEVASVQNIGCQVHSCVYLQHLVLDALSLEMASHKRSILTQTCVTSIGQSSRMLNVSWGCLYLNLMLIVILPFGLLFSFNYYNT